MGIYQIAFLEKIPKSAAVNESVELTKLARKRSAAGLVNAVLRKCEPDKLLQDLDTGLPGRSRNYWRACGGRFPSWLLSDGKPTSGSMRQTGWPGPRTQVPSTTCGSAPVRRSRTKSSGDFEEKGSQVRRGRYAAQRSDCRGGRRNCFAALAEEMGLAIQDEASQLVAELVDVRRATARA